MYSRNFGISIPRNYSGNRFSNQSEPSTKTHRADTPKASKRSHSPSFVTRGVPSVEVAPEPENEVYEIDDEPVIEEPTESSEDAIEQGAEDVILSTEDKNPHQPLLDLSGIQGILSGIERDELIILGLIFLFISDSTQKNTDIIALLALLLLG